MAASDSGVATPSKFEAHWPSQSVGTARAASGTAVRDACNPFAAFVPEYWYSPCMWWHGHAKVPTAFLVVFLT